MFDNLMRNFYIYTPFSSKNRHNYSHFISFSASILLYVCLYLFGGGGGRGSTLPLHFYLSHFVCDKDRGLLLTDFLSMGITHYLFLNLHPGQHILCDQNIKTFNISTNQYEKEHGLFAAMYH